MYRQGLLTRIPILFKVFFVVLSDLNRIQFCISDNRLVDMLTSFHFGYFFLSE